MLHMETFQLDLHPSLLFKSMQKSTRYTPGALQCSVLRMGKNMWGDKVTPTTISTHLNFNNPVFPLVEAPSGNARSGREDAENE